MKPMKSHKSGETMPASTRTDQPSLSVCMIVKNESELLPRCLTSLRDIADEIVLVDTGSTDGTGDIAREFDCRIVDFLWTGDFAAARNESIQHAGKTWILIVDADEELPAGAVDEIRRIMRRNDVDIVSLTVVNKSLETGRVSSVLPSIRLFRSKLGLRYEGIVHNRLIIPENAEVVRTAIELYHYGYDLPEDKLRAKQARSRQLLENQLQQNPDDVFANFNMAQLLMGLHGMADEGICLAIVDHAKRVIANHDPSQTGHAGYYLMAHYQMATALTSLRRYDEAEAVCRTALEHKSDYLDIILTLANTRLARADLPGARELYVHYLDSRENYRPDRERHDIIMHHMHSGHIARYGLGTISRLENNLDDAIKHYRRVVRDYGPYLDTCLLLGILYLRRGEPARAEEILTEEIARNPRSVEAHMALAKSLEAQGRGDQGIEHLRAAQAAMPDNANIHLALAAMLINHGMIDDGVDQIKTVAENSANDHLLRFKAAGMLFEVGEYTAAEDNYRRCLLQKPIWPDAYANLGNCRFRGELYEQAAACYETALALAPEHDLARRNLGLAYARSGRAEFAVIILQEYLQRHDDDVEICRLTGDLSLSSGHYSAAVDCYEKCLRADPGDQNCLFHLAEAYFAMGHFRAAEAGYRHLLELSPDFEQARTRLAEMTAAASI